MKARLSLLVLVLLMAIAPRVLADRAVAPPPSQGVAVIGLANARDDAFTLARAIYKSSLRPTVLDEVRARVLAGDAPPPNASKDVKDLAELRAGIRGDDAAGRQLLASIATRLNVKAILVVSIEQEADADAGAPSDPDAGATGTTSTPARSRPRARLFLADTGDIDAARYAPDDGMSGPEAWQSTVVSLERRYPPAPNSGPKNAVATDPASLRAPPEEKKPFYKSPWLWGGIGAALLLGGFFYFASRDTSDDPIHLEMRVPR